MILVPVPVVEQKLSSLFAENFQKTWRKSNVCSERTFSRACFEKKTTRAFVQRAKSCGVQEKYFPQSCQNCVTQFQQKILMMVITLKNISSSF